MTLGPTIMGNKEKRRRKVKKNRERESGKMRGRKR